MPTLTTEERATYTTRLESAEAALHDLMTGQSARVFVDQNGERVEYAVPNADRLRAYIYELKVMLGKTVGSRPMTFGML